MPTEIMCPDCGGVIFAAGADADANRACTCGKNVDAASVIAATAGVPAAKVCVNCGADVTQAKRLKDKDGNYWCATCGLEDSRRKKEAAIKAGGGAVVCPDCCGRFPKDKMVRAGSEMICEDCKVKRITNSKKSGKYKFVAGSGAQDVAKRRTTMMLVAIGVLLAIVLAWQFLL